MNGPFSAINLAPNVRSVAGKLADGDREEFLRLMLEAAALGKRVTALRTQAWTLARQRGAVASKPRAPMRKTESPLRTLAHTLANAGWDCQIRPAEPDDEHGPTCVVFTVPWVPDASVTLEYGSAFANFRNAAGYYFEIKRLYALHHSWSDQIVGKSWSTATQGAFIKELEQLVSPELAASFP